MNQKPKFGIYLNPKEKVVVRITSPYWMPESPEWVYLAEDANATLIRIKELAKEKGLVKDASALRWGSIPSRD